jgi:hypothetical protein
MHIQVMNKGRDILSMSIALDRVGWIGLAIQISPDVSLTPLEIQNTDKSYELRRGSIPPRFPSLLLISGLKLLTVMKMYQNEPRQLSSGPKSNTLIKEKENT